MGRFAEANPRKKVSLHVAVIPPGCRLDKFDAVPHPKIGRRSYTVHRSYSFEGFCVHGRVVGSRDLPSTRPPIRLTF